MYESGELAEVLGVERQAGAAPEGDANAPLTVENRLN